jgi:hypothetical protein
MFPLYQRTFYDKKIDERNKNIQLILDFMIQKKYNATVVVTVKLANRISMLIFSHTIKFRMEGMT